MSAMPLGNFTIRVTTGTNTIPSLAGILVESPGGGGGGGGGGMAGVIQFVIMSLLLLVLTG